MRNFSRLIGPGRHFLSAACLLFVLAATTNAYTIVMRGGKRVEIPAQFTVTKMTLTYEAAPGFLVTLQMAAIDIAATERVNKDAPGSLLGRAAQQTESPLPAESTNVAREPKASHSVTNRELESFARLRLESERAYEQKLKERGLPPLAELRARAAAEDERFWQELARKRAEAEANERASRQQAQIAALSAQLNYVQALTNELSSGSSGAFPVFGGFPSFGSFGRSRVNPALFHVPFGLPVGGGFGSFNVPFGSPSQFRGLRRNVIIAPGTQIRGRIFFGRGSHVLPRRR